MLKEGQTISHCPSGFPGCGCADEIQLNPHMEDVRKENGKRFSEYLEKTNNLVGKENNNGFEFS